MQFAFLQMSKLVFSRFATSPQSFVVYDPKVDTLVRLTSFRTSSMAHIPPHALPSPLPHKSCHRCPGGRGGGRPQHRGDPRRHGGGHGAQLLPEAVPQALLRRGHCRAARRHLCRGAGHGGGQALLRHLLYFPAAGIRPGEGQAMSEVLDGSGILASLSCRGFGNLAGQSVPPALVSFERVSTR